MSYTKKAIRLFVSLFFTTGLLACGGTYDEEGQGSSDLVAEQPVTPTPTTEPTPVAEPTPIAEPTPAAQPTPQTQPAPAPEPTPSLEPTPSPEVEPTPVAEPTPEPEPTPTAEPTPVLEPSPIAEPTPIPEQAPEPTPLTAGAINRSGWTLSASHNPGDLSNAIDDSPETRWTTREIQNNGQQLTIDLNGYYTFNTIELLSFESPNDYPRGYEVYISDDGSSWGSPVATGSGSSASTKIVFDDASARHVRIIQTGSASEFWWSVHDLYVSFDEDPVVDPKPESNVFSLAELREAIQQNNQTIVMRAGNYNMTELPSDARNLLFSGSNNVIDLTEVYIEVPVGSTDSESYLVLDGSNNTIVGGEFEDTYSNGLVEVTDFVSYNNDPELASGLRGDAVMSIVGDNNLIDGIKLTIRGSFPYGYGSIYGIGSNNVFGLDKRCGILITGDSNTIDNSEIQQRAFCHGIYMQSPADNTVIRNTLVEGRVRPTADMLLEGEGSLPYRSDYQLPLEGIPLPDDEVNSLAEDGIRSYSGSGSVVVENSRVEKMRGGIRLYLASSASVSNSTAIDCGATNYNMPRGGTVTNSSGNFTYAPLSDFRLSRSNQNLEITILPSPGAIGSHNIADIQGDNHDIVFLRANGPEDTEETRAIVVYGDNSTIRNETEYAIVLQSGTSGNSIISAGEVTDFGSNSVSRIDLGPVNTN